MIFLGKEVMGTCHNIHPSRASWVGVLILGVCLSCLALGLREPCGGTQAFRSTLSLSSFSNGFFSFPQESKPEQCLPGKGHTTGEQPAQLGLAPRYGGRVSFWQWCHSFLELN